jgi:DNA-binding NarL/FixJ family response regulator
MIRVLLADDHRLVRAGLETLLSSDEFLVVGTAADGAAAVELAATTEPDVILMDLSMPILDGVEATRIITSRDAHVAVVVLTSFAGHERVQAAIDAGATGYILKDTEPDVLRAAVRAAALGGAPLDPRVASAIIGRMRTAPASDLTERSADVLRLVGAGLSNKQIARKLGISEKTVKAHLTNIFRRIGVADRTQAALWAQRNGLLEAAGDT